MSFKNRIEAHYTTAITPLLMIATYPIISENVVLKKWFKRLALPVVILFFAFRFYMAADFLPNFGQAKLAFYNHKATMEGIKEMADGKRIGSFNNFDFPGTYEFYTGDPVIHMAAPGYRFCQFDLWDEEAEAEGDSLFVVIPDRMDSSDLIQLKNGKWIKTIVVPEFQSLKYLGLEYTNGILTADSLKLWITIGNHSEKAIKFEHPSQPLIGFTHPKHNEISSTPLFEITGKKEIKPNEKLSFNYSIPLNLLEDPERSILLFTQTVDRNRGQMVSIDLSDYKTSR
jgi:hypothetical protein